MEFELEGKIYHEGDVYRWNDCNYRVVIKAVINFGEWEQDGSAGEYTGSNCLGFYFKILDIVDVMQNSDYEDKDEAMLFYPQYKMQRSVLEVLRDEYCDINDLQMIGSK